MSLLHCSALQHRTNWHGCKRISERAAPSAWLPVSAIGALWSAAGAVAAAAVGGGTLAASFRCGATLLAFYFSSSRLTAWMEDRKNTDDAFKAGGQRDWVQARRQRFSRLGSGLG